MLWKARGLTRLLGCTSSGCKKIENTVLHSLRRRKLWQCELRAACASRESSWAREVEAECCLAVRGPTPASANLLLIGAAAVHSARSNRRAPITRVEIICWYFNNLYL